MAYSINIKKSVEKDLRKLSTSVISRVVEAIESLKDNPYPRQSKKLRATEKTYRLRVGNYRIIYQIDEERKEIIVYHVRHRENVYEKL